MWGEGVLILLISIDEERRMKKKEEEKEKKSNSVPGVVLSKWNITFKILKWGLHN